MYIIRRFTHCESCTEAGEYSIRRRTCFFACRLEVTAVAGRLWNSWCVWGGADLLCFFLFTLFFFERTRPAASMRPTCLIYLSTSTEVINALEVMYRTV